MHWESHLVYVPDVDIDVGGTQDPYPQPTVDGPQRLGSCLSVHVGRGGRDAARIGRHDKVLCRQLRVEAVFGHQHQVRHSAQHDATTDILEQGTTRQLQTTAHKATSVTARVSVTKWWHVVVFRQRPSDFRETVTQWCETLGSGSKGIPPDSDNSTSPFGDCIKMCFFHDPIITEACYYCCILKTDFRFTHVRGIYVNIYCSTLHKYLNIPWPLMGLSESGRKEVSSYWS